MLVTGMRASERTDFMGRTIRNSVAWVGEDVNEPILRAIAVRALQSFLSEDEDPSLKKEIDDAVQPHENEGFKVDFEALKAHKIAEPISVEESAPDPRRKIGKSDKRVSELVEELKECHLPNKEGPLVVFTGIKAKSALEQAEVWRGLSNLVEVEDWPAQKKIGRVGKGGSQADKTGKIIIILIISISLIALTVFLLISEPKKEPSKQSGNDQKEVPAQILPQKDSEQPKSPTGLPSTAQPESQPSPSPTTESEKAPVQVPSEVNSESLLETEEGTSQSQFIKQGEESSRLSEESVKANESETSSSGA
ncbi:hypothetical protein [Allocoleopsis franciscana]|uniref:hypothetical protein n=1 Tax=Allocoleopsis franciscana TaxID=2886352 RepID=UPI0012DDF6C6|nr:hypothetical protein [Allocoleopsis franciscana]